MRFWVKHTQLLQSTDQVLLKYGSAIIEVISSHELIDRVLVHVNEALQFVEHCILDLFRGNTTLALDVDVHLRYEFIVGDLPVAVVVNQVH
jgi:hypothetical protein